MRKARPLKYFYPRPPRGGRLKNGGYETTREIISIHALREEGDASRPSQPSSLGDFYPRPPRGGRPSWRSSESGSTSFLSTPSARRATRARSCACRCDTISIHALREEGDRGPAAAADGHLHFYPRPPRGGRPAAAPLLMASVRFLSTPSARRATFAHSTVPNDAIFLSTPSARRATPRASCS